MRRGWRLVAAVALVSPALVRPIAAPALGADDLVRYQIVPSAVDSAIHRFDEPHRAEESIVARLVALLRALHRDHPTEGWDAYLVAGQPNWARIAVSGLSQGAGMAAYIAQRTAVARVVLFSSPWDSYGPRRTLAPWITRGVGQTPAERWFAAYHEREPAADQITRAYAALGIPRDQVRVFNLEPADRGSVAPYHPSVVANAVTPRASDGTPAYLEQWRFLLGEGR